MESRLTVVTGPPGVDIGPAVAKLGAGLDDGMAVRVVRSNVTRDTPHTSPDPYHREEARPGSIGAVRLSVLPSAWQDPQTNLGVVYDAQPDYGLTEDVETLATLGLNPSHRLTVQSNIESIIHVRPPIEAGNVGVQARDAVLRAGGRVLIEAGDGQTFLQALATVGISPWADWIGHLDRWIVLDMLDEAERHGARTGNLTRDLPGIVSQAVDELDGSSGAYHSGQHLGGVTLRVALMNAQLAIPGLAGHDYNVATGEGDIIGEEAVDQLVKLLDTIADRTDVEVHFLGTGRIAGTGVWSWIDSGEQTA